MMKKSVLLSLATAAAVIATSAGTYAVWDTLEATATANSTITLRNPVTIEAGTLSATADESALSTLPSATANVSFTAQNADSLVDTLTLTPKVMAGEEDLTQHFTITVVDSTDSGISNTSGSGGQFVDSDLTNTSYTVTATAKDGTSANISGKELTIKVTGVLSKSE